MTRVPPRALCIEALCIEVHFLALKRVTERASAGTLLCGRAGLTASQLAPPFCCTRDLIVKHSGGAPETHDFISSYPHSALYTPYPTGLQLPARLTCVGAFEPWALGLDSTVCSCRVFLTSSVV